MRDFFEGSSPLSQDQVEMAFLAVKAMRGIFGLSQGDLSRLSGVSRPTISRLETGSDSVVKPDTLFHLIRVAIHLGLDVTSNDNGLVFNLSIKAIDRATCTSPTEEQKLNYELADLEFIIERMNNDWGSDATPKRLDEAKKAKAEIIETLKSL